MQALSRLTGLTVILVLISTSGVHATVPQVISFQGLLNDGTGTPVVDGSYPATFKLYTTSAGGTALWTESQSVTTVGGQFNVLLGTNLPIPDSAFADTACYLGVSVSPDPELTPRSKLASVGYSYRVYSVDEAQGGNIQGKVSIGPGHVNTGSYSFVAGASNSAMGNFSVIAGGILNEADSAFSTVAGGEDNTVAARYGTVVGGQLNVAEGPGYPFLGGGYRNRALGQNAVVSGGHQNEASGSFSSVAGGSSNHAGALNAAVGGGQSDSAIGAHSTVAGGYSNVASGEQATVAGGGAGRATGDGSVVSGGGGNTASGLGSTVGGGGGNRALGPFDVVGGGQYDTANGSNSTIAGGFGNYVAGESSTIGGGVSNRVLTHYGVIAGGAGNRVSDELGAVSGGAGNHALGRGATISGGQGNLADGDYAFIGGGDSNYTADNRAVVAGGNRNAATGYGAVVGGGERDTASGISSFVGGGVFNAAAGYQSVIVGGSGNRTTANWSGIVSGQFNRASGNYSFVGGGSSNVAGGAYSVVGGGGGGAAADSNHAMGDWSTIPGGQGNRAPGFCSFAAGQRARAEHSGAFVWADASSATFSSTATNQFIVRAAGGMGVGTNAPAAQLDVKRSSGTVALFDRTSNDGTVISIGQDGTAEGSISVSGTTVSYNAFTGSHYGWTTESLEPGMLVSLTGENRNLHDRLNAEVIYGIKLTTVANDAACLGAYLSVLEPDQATGSENPHLITAVGNGMMWIVESDGGISPGDYLIASDVTGHAMKDSPERFSMGHIVARAAERVDWNTVTDTVGGCKHKKVSVLFGNFVRSNTTSLEETVRNLEERLRQLEGSSMRAERP